MSLLMVDRQSVRRLRFAIGALGALTVLAGGAWAVQRQSSFYSATLDAISAGGGAAASSSWRQIDSAVGQESVCGASASAGFIDQAGVVQPWTARSSSANAWQDYR